MTGSRANARLEALCDGVFAIAMTLLILDVRLPAADAITGTPELWDALRHLAPSVFAFVLSFGIILITWVSHHATLSMVERSSARFIYANGLLLLTVVSVPFTAGLLGDFLSTDHAGPAVVLYNAVLALQAVGWILVDGAAVKDHLATGERAVATLRNGRRNGYVAALFYTLLAIAAFRAPLASAAVTTVSWIFWLVLGIRMQRA